MKLFPAEALSLSILRFKADNIFDTFKFRREAFDFTLQQYYIDKSIKENLFTIEKVYVTKESFKS